MTILGALGATALGGWVMSQAANASKIAAAAASAPTASPTSTPALGPLTPQQLAALQLSLPKTNIPAAPAGPLRPAAAPKPVAAPAPAPAAKTGTS